MIVGQGKVLLDGEKYSIYAIKSHKQKRKVLYLSCICPIFWRIFWRIGTAHRAQYKKNYTLCTKIISFTRGGYTVLRVCASVCVFSSIICVLLPYIVLYADRRELSQRSLDILFIYILFMQGGGGVMVFFNLYYVSF